MRTFATTCSFHFRCLLLLILVVQSTLSAPHRTSVAKPGCPSQCGNLTIPYPFGIGFSCSMAFGYTLTCDASTDPPKTFIPIPITDTKTQVFHISASEIRIINRVTFSCFNLQGDEVLNRTEMIAFTDISPYSFSASANKFTVIGCDVLGIIVGLQGLGAACGSLCAKQEDVIGGYCSAIGCCQALIPKGLNAVGFTFSYPLNHSNVIGFNPCVYAFLAEEDKFVFQGASDLVDPNFANRTTKNVPIVLDWSISNETCSQAKQNLTSYACQGNTTCSDSDSGKGGYHCYCLPGYEGNPYLTPGCTDIDECSEQNENQCSKNCKNTPGSYLCSCPSKYSGDGFINGTGCVPESSLVGMKAGLGSSIGVLLVLIGTSWTCFLIRKRRLKKLREQLFESNGGLLLEKQLSSDKQAGVQSAKIYTIKELKLSTSNFSEDNILGKGGYGTVYKGIFPNNQVVAIKKSKVVDQTQIEQFINEVVILTRINHRNVVQLLGCCLETEVPILVYEFIANGTLYDHIHSKTTSPASWLSWSTCLRIAVEAAEALAYLHSASFTPVIHRDVKSTNILLDENYAAKISDFGASRLVPLDYTKISTLVQGTLGYLDPEYFFSSQLTEKSDVYSFGVVVAELLTRQKPIPSERENLATRFVRYMREEDSVFEIIDPELVKEAPQEQLIIVADLVKKCLSMKGEDRPTMKDVAVELGRLRKQTIETTTNLLPANDEQQQEQGDLYPVSVQGLTEQFQDDRIVVETTSTVDNNSGFHSLHKEIIFEMSCPR
ncbi:wall-associated receptor kinase 2-like [Spinacia oleracea]|uniref:Wall-associated receptor kinase 2-like n=1 Tax=Spinacia oleracea TaxID=3562 RepID=A0A9R0HW60_SPIOL|nr:wall-associated receptor kinase 2-like [Spinacia oleracea]